MDARTQEFLAHVQDGGQVEATDWLPDEYRQKLVKVIEMHANSERMGVLPELEDRVVTREDWTIDDFRPTFRN